MIDKWGGLFTQDFSGWGFLGLSFLEFSSFEYAELNLERRTVRFHLFEEL
jgi:hypothetical protein